MTDTEEYNGWTNRETWATALHIDNDEGLYNYRLELRRDAIVNAHAEPPHMTKEQAARYTLTDSLKQWIEGLAGTVYFPDDGGHEPNQALLGMFHDIGSLWRVNWDEIATNFLSEEHDGEPKPAAVDA